MKKHITGLISLFIVPILMSNAPAPTPYPENCNYSDCELSSLKLSVATNKYSDSLSYLLTGTVSNNGNSYVELYGSTVSVDFNSGKGNASFYLCDYNSISNDLLYPNSHIDFAVYASSYSSVPTSLIDNITINSTSGSYCAYNDSTIIRKVFHDPATINVKEYDSSANKTQIEVLLNKVNNQDNHTIAESVVKVAFGEDNYDVHIDANISVGEEKNISTTIYVYGDMTAKSATYIDTVFLRIPAYYENREQMNKILNVVGYIVLAFLLIGLISIPIAVYFTKKNKKQF
jgi:hypothetical protein